MVMKLLPAQSYQGAEIGGPLTAHCGVDQEFNVEIRTMAQPLE